MVNLSLCASAKFKGVKEKCMTFIVGKKLLKCMINKAEYLLALPERDVAF